MNMKIIQSVRLAFITAVVCLLVAPWTSACIRGADTARTDRASQEDDIREAVVRWGTPKDGSNPKPLIIFVNFYDAAMKVTDPSETFFERLADMNRRFLKGSGCVHNKDSTLSDPKTGDQGESITVGPIEWDSDVQVKVAFTGYTANLGAGGDSLTLKKVDGKWVVAKVQNNWVS